MSSKLSRGFGFGRLVRTVPLAVGEGRGRDVAVAAGGAGGAPVRSPGVGLPGDDGSRFADGSTGAVLPSDSRPARADPDAGGAAGGASADWGRPPSEGSSADSSGRASDVALGSANLSVSPGGRRGPG